MITGLIECGISRGRQLCSPQAFINRTIFGSYPKRHVDDCTGTFLKGAFYESGTAIISHPGPRTPTILIKDSHLVGAAFRLAPCTPNSAMRHFLVVKGLVKYQEISERSLVSDLVRCTGYRITGIKLLGDLTWAPSTSVAADEIRRRCDYCLSFLPSFAGSRVVECGAKGPRAVNASLQVHGLLFMC